MATKLQVESLLFGKPTRVGYDGGEDTIKIAVKRYSVANASQSGITLVLTHANGSRTSLKFISYTTTRRQRRLTTLHYNIDKECWESMLENLFLSPSSNVREAWAFDAPDHGDSALANQVALKDMKDGICVYTIMLPYTETHSILHQRL